MTLARRAVQEPIDEVLQGATLAGVRSISQRELRNDNAAIMRDVEQGESFTVTRRGVPVALLTPIPVDADLRCVRPATSDPASVAGERVTLETPSEALLDDLRGDR